MEVCTHQVQYNGLCAVCGSLLETSDDPTGMTGSNNRIRMGYDTVGLTVSREEAERLEAENARRLLKDRKLSLIVDLDQTILHASWEQNISDYYNIKENDIREFKLPASDLTYYIKLRPGLNGFLKEINELYELHIYTMGTRSYAEAVAKEIDPNGSLFKERILSRDESGSVTQKKLQRLFPCDTSMVVVMDDRSDVWSFSPNLIRIKPYEFFKGTAESNDQELATMSKILREIHEKFYSIPSTDKEADVTLIIPKMKERVLKGKVITFSDRILAPFHSKDPSLSWIWQMATSFGATCSIDLTGKTTHLIAIQNSRNKVKAALEYGQPNLLHIVTPAWLLDSTARWSIQPEENYQLNFNELDTVEDASLTDDLDYFSNSDKEDDLIKNINWDETNREVEDFINESGIDDVWEDTEDSSSSRQSTPILYHRLKRKRVKEEPHTSKKSHLSKVISATNSGNTTDNEDSSLDDFAVILDKTLD